MSLEPHIGRITKTTLGYEDHGILTAYLAFDFGSAGQSAGGKMFSFRPRGKPETFIDAGMAFVSGVLRACGVSTWEEVTGRTVFALRTQGMIVGLRPLPTEKGKEFLFDEVNDLYPKYSEGALDRDDALHEAVKILATMTRHSPSYTVTVVPFAEAHQAACAVLERLQELGIKEAS